MMCSLLRSYLKRKKEQWSWMRWLPHAKLQELNVRGFVYNQRTRDQVLNSLNQILKLRRSQRKKQPTKRAPSSILITWF